MKKNFMKKALAVTLSAAMAFSLSSVNMMTASAAVHVVKTKNLTVGVKKKLKLKSNALGWKITKAKSNKTAVCKISKKAKGYVTLNPIKKGTAKITLTIKRTKPNKTVLTKKLVCKVTVQNAQQDNSGSGNDDQQNVDNSTATATNQDELNAALNNADLRKLTIATNEKLTFTIPAETYENVDLTVNAPNATVDNSGNFKSISIEAISDNTWIEKAIGNILNILSAKSHVVIGKGAKASVKVSAPKADVQLEVNGTADVEVAAADAKLDVAGEPEVPVTVQINAAATGTDLTTKVPTAVTANTTTDVKITVEEGGEGSSIAVKVPGKVELDVVNNSKATIAVTNNEGEAQTPVAVGNNGKVTVESKEDNTTTPGGNTPGGTTITPGTSTSTDVKSIDTMQITGSYTALAGLTVVTGSSTTVVSAGSIKITGVPTTTGLGVGPKGTTDEEKEKNHVSGCAIQYQVSLMYTNMSGQRVTVKSPTDKFTNVGESISIDVKDADLSKRATVSITFKLVQFDLHDDNDDHKVVAEGMKKSYEKDVNVPSAS